MKKNVGNIDRIVRLILAAIALILFFSGTVTGGWGIFLVVLAVILVATSFLSFCPIYLPFKISTRK